MELGRLIDTYKGARSYDDLARDCGGNPSSKRLQQLARAPIKTFPGPDTIRALGRGLRVSQRVVVLAAAESLGLDVNHGEPLLIELLPGGARDLTEAQAGAIAHLVQTIVDAQPVESTDQDEVFEPVEPTVKDVLQAQARARLQAVALEGDPSHAEQIDELAAEARREQTGQDH